VQVKRIENDIGEANARKEAVRSQFFAFFVVIIIILIVLLGCFI